MNTSVDKLKHAYQKGHMDAFQTKIQSIDSIYVDGISITIGGNHKLVVMYTCIQNHRMSSSSHKRLWNLLFVKV